MAEICKLVYGMHQKSKEFAVLVCQAVINYGMEYGRYGYRAVPDLRTRMDEAYIARNIYS